MGNGLESRFDSYSDKIFGALMHADRDQGSRCALRLQALPGAVQGSRNEVARSLYCSRIAWGRVTCIHSFINVTRPDHGFAAAAPRLALDAPVSSHCYVDWESDH